MLFKENTCPMRKSSNKSQKQPNQAVLPKNKGKKGAQYSDCRNSKKLLDIIWHLLITGEEYIDKHYVKKTITKSRKKALKIALEEAIPLLKQAGYTIIAPG